MTTRNHIRPTVDYWWKLTLQLQWFWKTENMREKNRRITAWQANEENPSEGRTASQPSSAFIIQPTVSVLHYCCWESEPSQWEQVDFNRSPDFYWMTKANMHITHSRPWFLGIIRKRSWDPQLESRHKDRLKVWLICLTFRGLKRG